MTENFTKDKLNRAVLVGLSAHSLTREENATEESMEELKDLLETAGGESVGMVLQQKDSPDPRTFIGQGKVDEVRQLVRTMGADMVIFDNALSPSQQRVLGEELCLLQQAADGTIEGFCHETLPILGVQWHPERQSGARLRADAVDAGPLLRYFVGQCSCKSAPGLVHCEKRGEADESHHTGSKSGAGTAYGG